VLDISDAQDERYLIGFEHGEFAYRVFDKSSRAEKRTDEGRWQFSGGEYVRVGDRVWHLRVGLRKRTSTQEPARSPACCDRAPEAPR
jgi:hypothetical protein